MATLQVSKGYPVVFAAVSVPGHGRYVADEAEEQRTELPPVRLRPAAFLLRRGAVVDFDSGRLPYAGKEC